VSRQWNQRDLSMTWDQTHQQVEDSAVPLLNLRVQMLHIPRLLHGFEVCLACNTHGPTCVRRRWWAHTRGRLCERCDRACRVELEPFAVRRHHQIHCLPGALELDLLQRVAWKVSCKCHAGCDAGCDAGVRPAPPSAPATPQRSAAARCRWVRAAQWEVAPRTGPRLLWAPWLKQGVFGLPPETIWPSNATQRAPVKNL